MMSIPTEKPLSPTRIGIRGLCPRCGQGHVFQGFLKIAPNCKVCGLDLSFADPADGPAFFVMSIVSFPTVGFAAWLEVVYGPPMWVQMLISIPLLLIGCLALLRPMKGWLIASQYLNKAEEARLNKSQPAQNELAAEHVVAEPAATAPRP